MTQDTTEQDRPSTAVRTLYETLGTRIDEPVKRTLDGVEVPSDEISPGGVFHVLVETFGDDKGPYIRVVATTREVADHVWTAALRNHMTPEGW